VIAIIGQGYVGLPLAIKLSESGINVIGLDIDDVVVNSISQGISLVEDVSNDSLSRALNSKLYAVTSNYGEIENSDVKIICVPTPLLNQKPNLRSLVSAVTSVGRNLKVGDLVIIESTIEPGTTRNVLIPILENQSNLKNNEFYVAYSPERIDPMNKEWGLENTPKLVAGFDDTALEMAKNFYSKFINVVIECESLEIAETAKLLENSFRYVNISFINEISIFCQKLGIDVNKVISAAATKPYGFMPFFPSIGVGGHCIPVDPLYLSNKAHEIGAPTRLIDLADQINQEMPGYFVGRAEGKLGGLKNKKILVVGVSYKPNVSDVRETPVTALVRGLISKGAKVSWHDDLVKDWNGEKSSELSPGFDLAIIATPHSYIDIKKLGDTPILDTKGSN
jgi:UDP-N-acetyl-D-glucosamine dehydrogenase